MGDDAARVGVGRAGQRVAGARRARVGIDPDHAAVERDRVGRRTQVLRAQRAALGGGRRPNRSDAARRIAARVARRRAAGSASELSPVVRVEGRAVAATRVERSVGPEHEVADRVARKLLAPIVHQHELGSDQRVGRRDLKARDPAADDAAVSRRARRRRAAVRGRTCDAPARSSAADRRIVGVGQIDVRTRREGGVERQREQSAVPEVVDVRTQVGDLRRRRVGQAVEDPDQAALLGDEDAAVGCEANGGRMVEPGEDRALREAGRQCDGGGGRRRERAEQRDGEDRQPPRGTRARKRCATSRDAGRTGTRPAGRARRHSHECRKAIGRHPISDRYSVRPPQAENLTGLHAFQARNAWTTTRARRWPYTPRCPW